VVVSQHASVLAAGLCRQEPISSKSAAAERLPHETQGGCQWVATHCWWWRAAYCLQDPKGWRAHNTDSFQIPHQRIDLLSYPKVLGCGPRQTQVSALNLQQQHWCDRTAACGQLSALQVQSISAIGMLSSRSLARTDL
jgi:hypothetical protein